MALREICLLSSSKTPRSYSRAPPAKSYYCFRFNSTYDIIKKAKGAYKFYYIRAFYLLRVFVYVYTKNTEPKCVDSESKGVLAIGTFAMRRSLTRAKKRGNWFNGTGAS